MPRHKDKVKRGVKNTSKVQSKVKAFNTPLHNTNNLTFDFSYKSWIRCIRTNNFSNKLKNPDEFAEQIFKYLYELIPFLQENWTDILKSSSKKYPFPHCHLVAKDKIELVEAVIEETHATKLLDTDDEFNIWQLGSTQGLRLFAIYNHQTSTLFPVFLDYHHQIHPDENHNHRDLKSDDFCPVITYQ